MVEHTRFVSVVEHTRFVSVVEQNDFNYINNKNSPVHKGPRGLTEREFSNNA